MFSVLFSISESYEASQSFVGFSRFFLCLYLPPRSMSVLLTVAEARPRCWRGLVFLRCFYSTKNLPTRTPMLKSRSIAFPADFSGLANCPFSFLASLRCSLCTLGVKARLFCRSPLASVRPSLSLTVCQLLSSSLC